MKKGLPQKGLKTIACLSMVSDHIGAIFFSGLMLRIIRRIAFPSYCLFAGGDGADYVLVVATRYRQPESAMVVLLIIPGAPDLAVWNYTDHSINKKWLPQTRQPYLLIVRINSPVRPDRLQWVR